jgi:polysaccharide pyruvyl transferase WcaK-like protein
MMKIGISGSYGGLNLGDEAILHSIIMKLREDLDASIRVFSRNPEDTLERHQVDRAIDVRRLSVREVLPEIEELDLFILGGGGILYDSEDQPLFKGGEDRQGQRDPCDALRDRGWASQEGLLTETPEGIPGDNTLITVRDRNSQKILEELGISSEIHVTADPALLLRPEPVNSEIPEFTYRIKRGKLSVFRSGNREGRTGNR